MGLKIKLGQSSSSSFSSSSSVFWGDKIGHRGTETQRKILVSEAGRDGALL
jgi:hypothetical protein